MNRHKIKKKQIAFKIWTAVPCVEKYKNGAAAVLILKTIHFILIRDDSFARGQPPMSVTGSLAYSFICSTQFSLLARVNTHKHQDWINMNINMNIMVKIHLLNFLFPLHNSTVKELVKTWLYSGMKCTFVLPWKLDPRTSKDIVFLSIEFQNPATVLKLTFFVKPCMVQGL